MLWVKHGSLRISQHNAKAVQAIKFGNTVDPREFEASVVFGDVFSSKYCFWETLQI